MNIKTKFLTRLLSRPEINFYRGYYVDDRKTIDESIIKSFQTGGVGCSHSLPPVDSLGNGGAL